MSSPIKVPPPVIIFTLSEHVYDHLPVIFQATRLLTYGCAAVEIFTADIYWPYESKEVQKPERLLPSNTVDSIHWITHNGCAPITRPKIKWEFPCNPLGQPDDPYPPRRLTREFPFDFRGGLSVHSQPAAIIWLYPLPISSDGRRHASRRMLFWAERKMGNIFIAIVYSEFQQLKNKAMKGIPIVIFYCVTYNLY